MRIVVAMSGGVDSSVAAALLAEQGHEVIGLSMQLYPSTSLRTGRSTSLETGASADAPESDQAFGRCCTIDDLHDARRVASVIGFPHYIVNFEEPFRDTVIANFVSEYATGRTPLPCAHCNSDLKFSTLLDRARGLGAHNLATGHYAQVARDSDGRWQLRRGIDPAKDQSYFLFPLTQDQLAAALFPVGSISKTEVRAQARRLGLSVAEKPDSQEICFVPDGDYAAFVAARDPAVVRGGAIVDEGGRQLGSHGGIHRFTIGQRKGLGIASPGPLYVLRIDAESGDVTVGRRASLERISLTARGVNWVAVDTPVDGLRVTAQIRHRQRPAPGRVRALPGGRAELVFETPQPAITPGQAAVFYDDDIVIGGGWIE
jgi:tRNA-uridine 2-sulfurtransferase